MRKALDTLSDDQRNALELAYYEGLTQTEIAARLGSPSARSRPASGRRMIRLRDVLGPVAS